MQIVFQWTFSLLSSSKWNNHCDSLDSDYSFTLRILSKNFFPQWLKDLSLCPSPHLAHSSMLPMITVQQRQHSLRPPVCIFWSYWGLLVLFSGDFKSLCQILQKHQGYSLRWPNGHSYEGFPHSSVGKNHQPWATLGKFEFFNCAVDIIPAPLQRPLEDKKKLLM